jgi:hypothetical protein
LAGKSSWLLLLRNTRIATERSVNRRSGGGQTCRRPGNPLGARQRPHHHAAVHRLCSKSRAGRPRRSVRSRINSRKCRPGIKTMCAGYRAFRSPWRAVHYGDAPGRPFPRGLRDPELHPCGRNLQCRPAGFACASSKRSLAGCCCGASTFLADLTDFGRLVRPHPEQVMAEVEVAKSTRCTSFQMDNAPVNHGRTDPLHELPRRVPGLASGREVTLIEGYSGAFAELLLDGSSISR